MTTASSKAGGTCTRFASFTLRPRLDPRCFYRHSKSTPCAGNTYQSFLPAMLCNVCRKIGLSGDGQAELISVGGLEYRPPSPDLCQFPGICCFCSCFVWTRLWDSLSGSKKNDSSLTRFTPNVASKLFAIVTSSTFRVLRTIAMLWQKLGSQKGYQNNIVHTHGILS